MVLSFLKDLALNSKWNFAYACHESAKQPVKSSPAKLNKRNNFNLLFTCWGFCSMLVRLLDILTRYKEKHSRIRALRVINAINILLDALFMAYYTLRRRNLKTGFSMWKHIKRFLFTPRPRSLMTQQSSSVIWMFVWRKSEQRNHIIFEMWSLSKNSVFDECGR